CGAVRPGRGPGRFAPLIARPVRRRPQVADRAPERRSPRSGSRSRPPRFPGPRRS
ncbi:MAG: hypothetical protein AVDCRST_MAG66-469, partial [uncultured Pseudonocardia sp.]